MKNMNNDIYIQENLVKDRLKIAEKEKKAKEHS